MLNFIKLQLKLIWGGNKNNNKTSVILTGIFGVLVIAVMLAMVYFLSSVLVKSIVSLTERQLLVFFMTIIEIALTFMGVSMQIKRLYRPVDLQIAARFPLSPFKQYAANILIIFINLVIYSLLLVIPILSIVSAAVGGFSLVRFMGIIVAAVVSSLIPFALSIIIAIPVMGILSLLENQNAVKMGIFISVICLFFILYNYILQMLADYFMANGASAETLNIWTGILTTLDHNVNPAALITNIALFDKFWTIFIVIGIFILLSALGLFFAERVYKIVRRNLLEGVRRNKKRNAKTSYTNKFFEMLKFNFKEILRTKAYSYFYLGIAIATPVLVFFCNRLVVNVGKAQIGGAVAFGGSVLVISFFMAMISAFSAISLSIEGKNFYITKLVPVSYRTQLSIKGLLNFLVSAGALLISCTVIISMGFLTFTQTLSVAVIELLFAIGLVFNGLNLNLTNPNLKLKANGETDEINITVMMVIGFVISVLMGALAIVLTFFIEPVFVYLILFGIDLLYAAINVTIFYFTAERRYAAIEF